MVEFPVEPKLAKMLLVSQDFGCSVEILTIAAMLQVLCWYLGLPDNFLLLQCLSFVAGGPRHRQLTWARGNLLRH